MQRRDFAPFSRTGSVSAADQRAMRGSVPNPTAPDGAPDRRAGRYWAEAAGGNGSTLTTEAGSFAVENLGSPDLPLLGAFHSPATSPVGGVLICSPLYKEWGINHRREVLLSWELAAQGFAVQRFSYRGVGDTIGATRSMTFDTLMEDAHVAMEHLLRRCGPGRIIVQGTRFGALVAAAVARSHPDASLVFWQPFTKGPAFFREIFRSRMIGDLKKGLTGSSDKDLVAELEQNGWIDVLGYPIGWEFYRSASDLSLFDLVSEAGRSGLLVQMSTRQQVKNEYSKLSRHFEDLGGTLEIRLVEDDEAWWFGASGGPRKLEVKAAALEAVSETVRFARDSAVLGDSSRRSADERAS